MRLDTLDQYWRDFVKRCIRGYNPDKFEDFRRTFYGGAIAYRNIIAKINELDNNEFNEDMAVEIILGIEKELEKYSEEV